MADPLGADVLDHAVWHPSPNWQDRRDGAEPDIVLIHYTNMQSAEAALERLCCPVAEVSCHYLIAEDGRLWQLVAETARAFHAGVAAWGAVGDVNSRSIGIELANRGDHPFPEPQMRVLEALTRSILQRWSIPAERVIGHSDVAPDRKYDPGARFDWRRLARSGLAVWPAPAEPAPAEAFRDLSTAVGYGAHYSDAEVLCALRLRFRPWAHGPLAPADMAVLRDMATRFPVDRPRPGA